MGMNDQPKYPKDRAHSLNQGGSNYGLPNISGKFAMSDKMTCANCKKLVDRPNPHKKSDGGYTCKFKRV